MHKTLTLCLIGCFFWTACADHNGGLIATANGPEAPINNPEDGLFPGDQSGSVAKQPGTEGAGAATDPEGEATVGEGEGGGNPSGGNGSGNGEGSVTEGGGQPVPEPSTLLLVGTGLAGAALLRRRRKTPE